jgi:uncharacterized membrane protein YdjX (TVP38/TMEM64 family)
LRQPLYRWLTGLALLTLFCLGLWVASDWQQVQALWRTISDQEQIERFVDQLGWLGPVAIILLNALQIVIAPVPGYIIQAAAGFLYGPLWGGIWASLGLFLGSMTAMSLARRFGRPLVQRLVGASRLAKWEQVTHSDSPILWTVFLLGPTGDLPYHLAGLARVSFGTILAITLCIRVPSVFVAAAVGAGVVTFVWWQFALFIGALSILILLFMRHQDYVTTWFEQQLQQRLFRSKPVFQNKPMDEQAQP